MREKCAITGRADLELLYSFPDFPVFMGCVEQPYVLDIYQDMTWLISKSSGLIQLKKLVPLEVLYSETHGAGGVGGLWQKHHTDFAKFVNKANPKAVLEIGGAHGILEKNYHKYGQIPWTIIEPNPVPVEGCKATFIKDFFDENFTYDNKFDTVVHSHVFEHIYCPDDFMKHLSHFMSSGKKLVFSLPNMQAMLERKYTNCIMFEHTVFLTEFYIEYILARHGFEILNKEYFMNDHSIFFSAIRKPSATPISLQQGLYDKNRKIYMNYINYHKNLISELNHKMNQTSKPIFLFGAHIFAQTLLAFGLDTDKIICLLDNDSNKHGRRLYGTKLKVASPKILAEESNPIVILKAGAYSNEIKYDILSNINQNTEFI